MPSQRIILIRHFGDVIKYVSKTCPIELSDTLGNAKFLSDTEYGQVLNKATKTFPGYIWEIKTVYRV